MNDNLLLAQLQRAILLRSIYLLFVPVMLLFTALACGTLVTDTAFYTCPTSVPVPTVTTLPGTPVPTTAPPPTPFTLAPPQNFYLSDAIFVGQPGAPLRLRFRLLSVQSQPAPPLGGVPQNLYTWRLEIRNLGTVSYETVPVALMLITALTTPTGEQTGAWLTALAAMNAAGFTDENYDALLPGATRVYRLAAFAPAGSIHRLAYLLDGGSNRITWVNQPNPTCTGDVADQ